MTAPWIRELERDLPGRVRRDEPLAPYTTYRIGGRADALVEPAGSDDVAAALAVARRHDVPWHVLGLGSNVLVADAGLRGLVLRIGKGLDAERREGERWHVGAGLPTPLLARRSAAAGLAGVHRLVGVPGTVGGGVVMNAGAHGQEFRDTVRSVTLVTAGGAVETRPASAVAWGYRTSGLRDVVVIAAEVALTPEDPARLRREIAQHLRWRKAGTPFREPCCGSVFRNPSSPVPAGPRDETPLRTAGQLIDAAGLKGYRVGGAEVSSVHANYVVNTGGATAADVRQVIADVRARVHDRFGAELVLEVRMLGFG